MEGFQFLQFYQVQWSHLLSKKEEIDEKWSPSRARENFLHNMNRKLENLYFNAFFPIFFKIHQMPNFQFFQIFPNSLKIFQMACNCERGRWVESLTFFPPPIHLSLQSWVHRLMYFHTKTISFVFNFIYNFNNFPNVKFPKVENYEEY